MNSYLLAARVIRVPLEGYQFSKFTNKSQNHALDKIKLNLIG